MGLQSFSILHSQFSIFGVANIINLFNPQVVVLGGWVALRLGPYLLPELPQFVERYALKRPLGAVTIQLCALPYNPVSMGAATFALEGFLATVDTANRELRIEDRG